MPSHPDRVRKNYEDRIAFTFKGIPFHVCDKAPRYPPIALLTPDMKICPYCHKEINKDVQ